MNDIANSTFRRYEVENSEKWTSHIVDIPMIEVRRGWRIKAVPPFGGAMARLYVEKGDAFVSIYLDCHNRLGFMPGPYWEVCPVNGDVARCHIDEAKRLQALIEQSIREQDGIAAKIKKLVKKFMNKS